MKNIFNIRLIINLLVTTMIIGVTGYLVVMLFNTKARTDDAVQWINMVIEQNKVAQQQASINPADNIPAQ